MAERAGLFQTSHCIDYGQLSTEAFDWNAWVDIEMRVREVRNSAVQVESMLIICRLANHIFVIDQGNRIFSQSSTHISPLELHADTPCYYRCWAALTAEQCLEQLQLSPVPVSVTVALKTLRTASPRDKSVFHASDVGMHSIIIGWYILTY